MKNYTNTNPVPEQNLANKYSNILNSSKTAYLPGVKPTSSDIHTQEKQMTAQGQADLASNNALKNSLYGTSSQQKEITQPAGTQSYFHTVLETLGAPQHAISGTLQYALGKSPEKNLIGAVTGAVKRETTMGDIIRQYNVPNIIAAPVGFALDIMTDPINWWTMGTEAFVPKLTEGAIKGAGTDVGVLGGIKTAVASDFYGKAEKLGKFIGLSKRTFEENLQGGIPNLFRKISKKAVESRLNYESLIGKTLEQTLTENATKTSIMTKLGDYIEEQGTFGKKVVDFVGYKPSTWFRMKVASDNIANDALKTLEDEGSIISESDLNKSGADILMEEAKGLRKPLTNSVVQQQIDEGLIAGQFPETGTTSNSIESLFAMQGVAEKEPAYRQSYLENYIEFMKNASPEQKIIYKKLQIKKAFETGVGILDKLVAKSVESKIGRASLDFMSTSLGLFKTMKIGGNLTVSLPNSIVGNSFMTLLAGINPVSSDFLSNMSRTLKFLSGKDMSLINSFKTEDWMNIFAEHPDLFQAIFSVNPELFTKGRDYLETMAKDIISKNTNMTTEQLTKAYEDIGKIQEIFDNTIGKSDAQNILEKTAKLPRAARQAFNHSTSVVENAMNESPATFLSQEVISGPYTDFLRKIEMYAKDRHSFIANAFYKSLTVPMDIYAKSDQVYRLALALTTSETGVTIPELLSISKNIKINPEDVEQFAGRNVFRIKPLAAMELSSKVYMNYAAMPGFVKLMRVLPIVGSPFISFAYGMGALTLKAGLENPAVFNKVGNLIHEINGKYSPLEKVALNSPFYGWLKNEGMLKIPFFQQNPTFVNLGNMIPWYQLNMFQPSHRSYKNKYGGALANFIDKTPFFKTPGGQLLMDYGILPYITGVSQNMFGGPLYPKNATISQKLGSLAQSVGEIYAPPVLGVAGPLLNVAPKIIPYIPNYRMRQTAYAMQGKNSQGISGKEPAAQRTLRTYSSLFGVPTYQINLKTIERNINKKNNKK